MKKPTTHLKISLIWNNIYAALSCLCSSLKRDIPLHPQLQGKEENRFMQETLPVALGIILQQLLHHVLHPDKPARHSFVDQWSIWPAQGRE